jgi:hypothetical protein
MTGNYGCQRRIAMAEDRHIYGEDEFRKTAHKINRRARTLGTSADYDEKWGAGR